MAFNENTLLSILALVKEAEYFDGLNVTLAYPNETKPVLLETPTVTLRAESAVTAVHYGDSASMGDLKIFIGVFVPYLNTEADGDEILEEAVTAILAEYTAVSVLTEGPVPDSTSECMVTRATLTLNGEFDF